MGETPHERMQAYERLADQEREIRAEKRTELDAVSDDLTSAVEDAIEEAGASVAVTSIRNDGTEQTLTARLDRAALVAAVADALPEGFAIKRLTDDGSLTVEWDRRGETGEKQRAKTILTAIVSEELETDADGLIVAAPTKERIIERAGELGVDGDLAADRLDRLVTLDVVDVEDGRVYPGSNFSGF